MLCTLLLQSGGGAVVAALIATTVAAAGWLGKTLISGMLHYLSVWGAELERLIALRAEITGAGKAPVADHISGGRMGGRMEISPVSPDRIASYIVIAPVAINSVAETRRAWLDAAPYTGRHA
ncbi:hypothetical protein SAMN05880582_10253 [Rhizobium sp. RU20A]|uniref:hypothetical protein n=1 Tax=Rhizobium sp. RU20A TaxID=1907412 RepID=UPI000955C539|nr:hypothetical protein [Rhizobium sp. RU20A]SIQ53048.1 hypothetical protein SAMN05880582_10253 [Rhizobium sp. RU20A]